MDDSYTQYRDKSGVNSDSDSEIIDNSDILEDSSVSKKKYGAKNQTLFVAESEHSSSDGGSEEDEGKQLGLPKIVVGRSSGTYTHKISSSDDDVSHPGSLRRHHKLQAYHNSVVLSSSDEDEGSPEMVPKRRPTPKQKSVSPNTSIIGRKKNKRVMRLMDSDTEDSIVIEHNKYNKMACLKDTPLKLDDNATEIRKAALNESIMDQSIDGDGQTDGNQSTEESDDENKDQSMQRNSNESTMEQSCNESDEEEDSSGEIRSDAENMNEIKRNNKVSIINQNNSESDEEKETSSDVSQSSTKNKKNVKKSPFQKDVHMNISKKQSIDKSNQSEEESEQNDDESDDGPDEDQMVMSRATRMSIMGVIPKGDDSDESDFIESDDKSCGSTNTTGSDLPDAGISIHKTPEKPDKSGLKSNTSQLTCSPFSSPLHDITNDANKNSIKKKVENYYKDDTKNTKWDVKHVHDSTKKVKSIKNPEFDDDVTFIDTVQLTDVVRNKENVTVIDDDLAIIDRKAEVIALSSDDEEASPPKSNPNRSKESVKNESTSQRNQGNESGMKRFLVPPSYPNQVVYVSKEVLSTELAKLNGLKADLKQCQKLLSSMRVEMLPDGGAQMIERLSALEHSVRLQGDKVGSMVVETEIPSPEDVTDYGTSAPIASWEDLEKGSNAVQPRMFGKQAMSTHMAGRHQMLDRLHNLHVSLASRPPESELAAQPSDVRTELMPHQLHALAWLRWRETQKPCGGILADDMGLGKTITMISLVCADMETRDQNDDEEARGHSKLSRGGTLVVCPASLVQQWSGEVKRHCRPHALTVCMHHGPARTQHPHRLAAHNLVITTYNILQKDNEKKGVLMQVLWRRVILDEAHIVRNYKSATSTAVSALPGRRRWCLTGTPVHNKDLDLFALIKFLRCTPFDELTMWKKWIDNKSVGGQERLATVMQCLLLRRTKQVLVQRGQLQSLPARTTHHEAVTLSKEEMNVYQKVLVFSKTLFAQFLHQRAEKNADQESMTRALADDAYARMHKKMVALQGATPVKSHEILVLLLRLRQVCCHCGLIAAMLDGESSDDVTEDLASKDLLEELNKLSLEEKKNMIQIGEKETENEEEECVEERSTAAEAIRSVLSLNNPVFSLQQQSSKIIAVMKCLKNNVFNDKSNKAVVVSQWTSVLRLVESELKKEGVRSVTLTGEVPVAARARLVDSINDPASDVKVMLLSLGAGGVGLNLCGANHLLLLDPHWNPQLEEQAQDRIYRVGQTKPVHIYRFMCLDTVEHKIRKLQEAKLELANNVLTGARNASKLSIEDLKMLFNMA